MSIFCSSRSDKNCGQGAQKTDSGRTSHPSHEAPPCLAIIKAKRCAFLSSLPPTRLLPAFVEAETQGACPTVFDFLGRQAAWMAFAEAKVRQPSNVAGCYRSGLVYCFHVSASQSWRQCILTGRVATHLRKNAEPEWKRPRVKRYGRCARSPPLQRTSGTLTRRVLTLWNFCLLLARARSLWSVWSSR